MAGISFAYSRQRIDSQSSQMLKTFAALDVVLIISEPVNTSVVSFSAMLVKNAATGKPWRGLGREEYDVIS